MTATDETLDWEGKEHLEWHGCDLPVVQVFRRTSRAVGTELAAYKRARPMRGKSDHGGTSCRTSDARNMLPSSNMFLASFVLLDMVQHSGISKQELRLPGVQS